MLELIHTEKQFEDMRGEWTELLTHSSSDCVFLTWEWLFTWWKRLASSRSLHLVAVRIGGELIAIAPFASPSARWMGLARIRTLEFLGTGSVGSDYLDVIARNGRENEAVEVLVDYFRREKFVLDLKQLQDGSLAFRIAARLQQEGWKRSGIRTNVCPFIDLAGHTWDSFQASLGSNHRYNFHRRLKNLKRDFDVGFECAASDEQRRIALEVLVSLHNKRWDERGGSDGLHSPRLVEFHEAMTGLAMSRGWLRLFMLTLNGIAVAALYGFQYGGKFYFYQSGFDPEYSASSVGLVTMGLAIQAAIEEGSREFDLLHGAEKYKSLWAKQQRGLERLEVYPPHPAVWVYEKSIVLSRMAKRAARASLAMMSPSVRGEAR